MSDVLQRIAERLAAAGSPPAAHDSPGAARAQAPPPATTPDVPLVEQFASAWRALAGEVHQATPASAADVVIAVCRAHGATRVLGWAAAELACPEVVARCEAAGIAWDLGALPAGGEERAARLATLDPIRVGVTGALGAIAASGSIALVSGPGRSRLASLLPPVHVAIVPADRVYPTISDFLAAHPQIADAGSNLVVISGPSRTADIEMTLTRGVHGPGDVHAVLVSAEHGAPAPTC